MAYSVKLPNYAKYVTIDSSFEGYHFSEPEMRAMLSGDMLMIRTSKRDGVKVFIDRTSVSYRMGRPYLSVMEVHVSSYDMTKGDAYVPLSFLGHTFLEEELTALRLGETIMCSFLAKSGLSYYPCRIRLVQDNERNRFSFDLLTHEFHLPVYTRETALFHPMIYDVYLTPKEVDTLRKGGFVQREVIDEASKGYVDVVAHLVEKNGRFVVEPYMHTFKTVY